MPICPECKGKGKWEVPSNHPLDVYKIDGPIVYETYACETCDGTGSVSRLGLAVYKAQGGQAKTCDCEGPMVLEKSYCTLCGKDIYPPAVLGAKV